MIAFNLLKGSETVFFFNCTGCTEMFLITINFRLPIFSTLLANKKFKITDARTKTVKAYEADNNYTQTKNCNVIVWFWLMRVNE